MKILSKEEVSRTIYYDIEIELDDGKLIECVLIAYWEDDNSFGDWEFKIVSDNKEEIYRQLSEKQLKGLEELAINY